MTWIKEWLLASTKIYGYIIGVINIRGDMKLSQIGLKSNDSMKAPLVLKLRENRVPSKSVVTTEVKTWNGELVNTKDIPDIKYPFAQLNPPQSEFYVNRFLDSNFIISAATSAGKTVMAELSRNGKLLYLSPLKAISQEKWEDWSSPEHSWHSLNISISTGDYQLTPDRVEEMRRADVIVMTSEMLDSRSRNMASERNDWLLDIKTLVIDEFHLLSYEGRGDKLESAIIRFTAQNPNCRLICLSATMPNVGQLADWLTKLNGKQTTTILSNYRPVTLHRHYETYMQTRDYGETERIKIERSVKIAGDFPDDKFIIFVHSKNTGAQVLRSLEEANIKSEFHSADLDKETRLKIQADFNSKDRNTLRVLVSTSTLAWGVNTPADRVVLVGLHRGLTNLISNQDVHQMCGRAGRVGKTAKSEGHAYILVPNINSDKFIEWCEKVNDIKSRMNSALDDGVATLCFHILAEVLIGTINDAQTLITWYDRTLAKFQGDDIDLEKSQEILNTLEKIKTIKKEETGLYSITGLGRVSAYLYYSPFDIYAWYRNFSYIQRENLEDDNTALAWALGNIDSLDLGYIPKHQQIISERWIEKAFDMNLSVSFQAPYCAVYNMLLNGEEELPYAALPIKRQLQSDLGRAMSALKMIDKFYGMFHFDNLWKVLEMQVRYGVGKHLIDLVSLPGIGAKRADKLYKAGVHTRKDFIEKPAQARAAITVAFYDKIIKQIG